MAERRARILAAARGLIAEGGFEGLTMRQLAELARVSVPTVYNLIGNKFLLLEALVKEQFAQAANALARVPPGRSIVEYVEIMTDVTHDLLLGNPRYTRALIQVFLTADDSAPARRAIDAQCLALIGSALEAAQAAGEIASWADAPLVARQTYALYVSGVLGWASGELEEEALRMSTRFGLGLLLLGLSEGEPRARLEKALRKQQRAVRRLASEPARTEGG